MTEHCVGLVLPPAVSVSSFFAPRCDKFCRNILCGGAIQHVAASTLVGKWGIICGL